jgi:hypothetical protein
MSDLLDALPAGVEPERKATPHTAVLDEKRRETTALKSGLIDEKDALHLAYYQGVLVSVPSALTPLHLGPEAVFYEVAINGHIYRGLARPDPGQGTRIDTRDLKYSLARAKAPGLREDGVLLEAPATMPNTPRALALEMQGVLGLELREIIDNAYSILSYRRHNGAEYPDTMTPAGYTFREAFLMSVDADGNVRTLYETPKGAMPEKWTHFLKVLDRKSRPTLAQYVVSSMAIREFGEGGAAAMREALTLRDGGLGNAAPMTYTTFAEAFPIADSAKLERIVGGPRR